MYFFNTPKEVHAFIDMAITRLGLDTLWSNITGSDAQSTITNMVSNNWTTIIGVGGTALMAGISYFKYKSELASKKEALEIAQKLALENTNVSIAKDTATSKIQELQKQIETLSGDTTAETLQSRLSGLVDEKSVLESQVKSLVDQNQALMDKLANTPVKIVEVVK
jgi:hypothetical protein